MKWIMRIVLAVVLLVVIVLVIVYLSLNSIIRSAVQTEANASLNVPTTLGGAHLAILGGQVGLSDLEIGSPPNYSAPHMFTLGGVDVAVNYGQLSSQPVHISKIAIDQPVLVVQQNGGKFNFQALMDQMPKSQSSAQPMKLVIDELDLTNAQVNIEPGIPGFPDTIPVSIPSLTLKNIGNADGAANGAALKDVVMQVTTALASSASHSVKLPSNLNDMLNAQVGDISKQLGGNFTQQLQSITGSLGKNLPAGIGDTIKNATGNGASQIEQGLGGLLGGKKPATQP